MTWNRLILALAVILCFLGAGAKAQTDPEPEPFPVIWPEWQASVEAALTGKNFSFSRWEIYAPNHDRLRLHYGPTWDKQVSIDVLDEGTFIILSFSLLSLSIYMYISLFVFSSLESNCAHHTYW